MSLASTELADNSLTLRVEEQVRRHEVLSVVCAVAAAR
jgi:hypothetical protein